MKKASCPIDGCDYKGTPRSVEAHISASTTGQHKGEVGRTYRERLRNGMEPEASGDAETGGETELPEPDPERGGSDVEEPPKERPLNEPSSIANEDDPLRRTPTETTTSEVPSPTMPGLPTDHRRPPESRETSDDPGGIPLVVIVLVIAIVLVALWYLNTSDQQQGAEHGPPLAPESSSTYTEPAPEQFPENPFIDPDEYQ